MDDKVQKLLQRAIQENLSPDRVAYIMQFNGYDQAAIDSALSELSKKKRPVVFQEQYDSSDTQSQSQPVGPPAPSDTEETEVPSIAPYEPVTFDQGTGGVSSTEDTDEVEVTTGDWWGNAWNGLVEGVSDFMYAFNKETGATQEQIAEFVELSKEKYPDLYRSYEQNKQNDYYKEQGYDQERINRESAANAYIEYWGTHPEIENEVVPYIRQRRRELAIEEDGVKIDQAVQEKLDQQFLASSVKGLTSSVPAMVTSGVTMGGSFMSTSYYAADENLKNIFAENPDLEMTRGQQEAYKLTVAGIEGVLEKIGLSGTLRGTSMAKNVLTAKVFSRLAGMTDDIGTEAFERVVKEEVKGLKGYLKKTAQGTLSEAETGALQQLSNDLINETVNGLSGQEVFKPKDAMTILKDALYAGAQEAVGGGIISGTIGTFSNDIATQEDFDAAEEFIGRVDLVKMEENLNKRVEQGQITEDKKKNILEAAKGFKDTMAKVPEDMDQESKRKVYQLINKKMQIQNKTAGKDEAIQNKAKERVESINQEIANIYDSQAERAVASTQQAGQEPGQVQQPQAGTQASPTSGVVQETKIDVRFHSPTIEIDTKGEAVIDPAKVKEESFTGASVVAKGHVDEDTAKAINRAVTMLGEQGKKLKVRVFDSVESLLNADQRAANFYAKNKLTPKAYISGNEMFVLSKNAVEQYNAAKGTDVEYAKQYVHEVGHPIVSSLVAEDAEIQGRLYAEIEAAAEAGDAVAQRALNFGKQYSVQGDAKIQNETVVEFFALATDKKRFDSLPRSTKQKIIDFFNSLLNAISSDITITTDQQLYDIARDMRDAYRMQKGIKVQPTTNKQYQKRSTEFSIDEGTTPGNRLFNAPLEDALAIAEKYAEEKGISYDAGKAFNTLDTEMSQEIAQAYDAMDHDPKNPEVKKAYDVMVKETVDQYEAILAEGYVVEINNNEPYSSSKDMIEDLRENKRMKIFSTESGFGDAVITDDQRADNPLLRDSGFKDVNGEKLLVNDVFRFVHDFFGHAKRGNGFGPKGEENAWDVHSRMYTPLARRAMTSETRGQNSWVNFSGVNDEAFKLRDKARRLRKEGRTDEASKLIEQVYETMAFAEQKIGLMPEKYTANPYIEGGDPDFSLDEGVVGKVGEEFSVSDEINTDVESKGTPRLDDVSFSIDEKVKRHEGRGKIVRGKIKDFVGKIMHVTFSDRMVGGFVGKEEYLGGVYFPYITNSLWGANSTGAANKIIKAAVKNADGFRYMVIGMMNPDSHMSNLNMSTKALKELENELNSSRVTVEEGYNRIMKAFDKKALKEKFGETVEKYKGKRQTKANLIKLIDETVLSSGATFDLRRSFLETVLGKADKNLKLRFGNLPSYSTLAQMLAEPVTRGMNAGDTSFIVRTKGDLSVAEPKKGDPDYHPSYKYIVRSSEDVELVFLDGIYNVVDMFPRIEAKNLGHKEYQDKYGDNWKMRYLMYMGLGKMSTTVSDEMVEADAKAAIDFSTDEGDIDFAGIDMKVKEVPASTNAKIPTGGIAYVPVSTLYNLMDMREGRKEMYESKEDKKRVSKLVEAFKKEGFEYKGSDAIYVDIDADGYGWIGEGNHRVLAAMELGMTHLPVRVEFGAARDGKSFYSGKKVMGLIGTASRVPTQVISRDKIEQLKEQAGPYYHIKYASIWETDLPTNKPKLSFSTDEGINWYESPEGKGDPSISRRDNLLEEAAQDLKAGRLKNYEFREMAKALSPIEPITRFFAPATTERMAEALEKSKLKSLNVELKDGEVVALRLDIPAYTRSNTWVVSIHDGKKKDGKIMSYRSVARITDVVFKSNPLSALSIAGGEAKSTIGRMFGKYKNLKGKTPEAMAEDAKSIVAEIWNKPEWKQIGMNPTRASYFYDRKSGRPVVAAEEVVQIGGLVYAKNPVFTRWNDPAFEVKGYKDVDGSPIYFSADEGAGNINNLRGAIKRTLPRFAESRDRILANPEAYYTKQSLKAIKENLELMTEDELLENMTAEGLNRVANSGGPGKGENDISVLAAVELINRKSEAGEDVSELLVDLAKVGTTVGRMLRHFAELKSATPLGIVATIEGALAKANRIMTQSQVERLTDIADRFIKAQQKVKDLRDQIESEFSKKTEKELKDAAKELDKVTRELNKFTSLIVPKKTMDLLSTTIQGNLLTPISQITNVGANLFQIMTSIPTRGFETLFSKITGRFTGGNKRSFVYSMLAIPHAIKMGGKGVAEAIDTIIRGGASTEKIIHTGFLPGAAFLAAISDTKFAAMVNKTLGKEVIKGDVLARMANGKISAQDRLKALYEGMFGIAPEVMFRFLALGDKPFSRFSEGMESYQQAYRLGLKGEALRNYVKYPSKKQQKAIEDAGKKLTFQQDSKIATGFFGATNWLQKQGPIGQAIAFSLKLTMPYVKTPANIFVESLKFAVPGIGVASAIRNFQKKNYDEGSKDLAMAATGQMLVMAANTLIANGLLSGSFGDEDEDERALKYLKFPPMSINKSGLIRLLNGEDPSYRDGDIFIRYDKFGIPGMVIGARVTSIKNNLAEAQQQEEGYYVGDKDKGFFEPFSKVFDELGVGLGTVQFLNSQSFLTGANGLLKVLSGEASEYDVEKWMENTFRSLTAIPFPNTMSAVHRSIREYMPNLRTKSIETKFRYIVMDRLFESEGIPIKIDMLGRKIPQTPEGVKSWYYNLVDFTKEHPVEDQPVLNEIYRLYSLQEDANVIPGFPTKLTRIPTKHPETGAKVTGWDPKKEEEYRQKIQKVQEVYAQNRADILSELFTSDVYNGLTNEQKQERVIETLQKYDLGYVKIPKMKGMPTIKPPMEWKKMLDELNNQYFK